MTRIGAAVRAHLGLADMTPGAGRGLLYILVVMVILYGGSYYQSSHAVNGLRTAVAASASQHRAQVYACHLGNDARARQVILWTHIARIANGPPHETPAAKRARMVKLAAFLAYVRRTFPQLDCAAIYRIRPP